MQQLNIHNHTYLATEAKEIIEQYIRSKRHWSTQSKYLLSPHLPTGLKEYWVSVNNIEWLNKASLWDTQNQSRKYTFQDRITISCTIGFPVQLPDNQSHENITTDLNVLCKLWFDFNLLGSQPKIELLDEKRQLLNNYNEAIFNFYKDNNLNAGAIESPSGELRNRLQRALYSVQPSLQLDPFDIVQELTLSLQRFRFSLGNMAMYYPYLDNPLWHEEYSSENQGSYYPSYATLYDERYNIFCEFAYQSLYNFWGRIGELLHKAIGTSLRPNAVDFARVIDQIKLNPEKSTSPHFQWLLDFKEGEYSRMNTTRKETVHYETLTSTFSRGHIQAFSDKEAIISRQRHIEGLVDYFKQHFGLCVKGYEELTAFIETNNASR